jgi:hypothetical protein
MLGGMARDLDSGVLRRLQESYGGMSDGELLALAGKPDDLTDLALEVLRGEMAQRRLELVEDAATHGASGRAGESMEVKQVPAGSVPLITFNDAIAAGEACKLLEAEGMEIDVRDLSATAQGGSFYGGPPVALQIVVRGADERRAQETLRAKMGLFPLHLVEGDDAPEEGALRVLGYFGRHEDAEEVGRILEEAGVWHQLAANPDGDRETEDAYGIEVKEVDQPRAVEIVDKAMGISEG